MAEKGTAGARLAKLGRYEVLNELGKGAMGVVYLAKDPVIGRMVAIKTIRSSSTGDDDSESREFRERFVREAQTAGILSHPNIVTIHDIGEDSSTQTSFIAMEYIEGKNLKSLLAEKAHFTYDEIADMIAQVAEALDYAHRKGIIHRDIKPANIIITTDAKVKITDFGIAKIASSNLTTTGQFLGTPNYMSPEQVSGAPVDGRSDIFSLGVVLYELLTKRKPFVGENLTAISYKIVHEDFTPPAELSSDVPPEFNPIVARAMAKDPWNRYQRGKDLALALHQLRAHLEEQKALQDLGTIVSEAEFMPTLRLANLEQLVAEGALEAKRGSSFVGTPAEDRPAEVLPPKTTEASSASPRATPVARTSSSEASVVTVSSGSLSVAAPPEENVAAAPDGEKEVPPAQVTVPQPPAHLSGEDWHEELPHRSAVPVAGAGEDRATKAVPPAEAWTPPAPSWTPSAPSKIPAHESGVSPKTLKEKVADLTHQDWATLARAEVNPLWFWRVTAAVIGLALLISIPLIIRRAVVSRPSVAFDPALEKDTQERRQSLEEGKKLFAAGRYQESLALFRRFLARSPNNRQAREYAQMAESAMAAQQEQARKSVEAEKLMQTAQAAFAEGKYEDAKRQADEVLALDGGRVEAQTLREEASVKIAEAAAASKKKAARNPAPPSRRVAVALPEARVERPTPPQPAAPSPSVATRAMLRLIFNSPISEGHVMVAVNEQILLRRPFSFKRKEGLFKTIKETGTVDVSMPVQSGPLSVKVWLSGPDIPSSTFATASAQISGGETRVLRIDYSGGRLSARVQ